MSFMENLWSFIFGDPNKKFVEGLRPIVDSINALENSIQPLSDSQLKEKTNEFRQRLQKGESLDQLLPEAFAVVREGAKRVLGMRHFDVQLIGGIVLHQGKISEMKTGEGKTLVSTLPAYLNALEGKGVYVVTVNDYLAKRDSQWMGKVFEFLGLTVGLIHADMPAQERLKAYECDITYGTNNEFGFDYLRDHLAYDRSQICQIRRHFAIIDEVDSILIDEARTPLIISGPVQESTAKYAEVAKVVKTLQTTTHFTVDEKHKNVILTEEGASKIEAAFGISDLYSVQHMDIAHMSVQCLKALLLYKKDVDYVVKDGEVLIVDEFTGRILDGRRYSDGLHQAIEAVERLNVKEESQTMASITFQNYFRMFPKLGGMTGTAATEKDEFIKIYGLDVITIPTHRAQIRKDMPDLVYKSKKEKYKAVVELIKERHAKSQPTLVGTISIEMSELISNMLKKEGIPHNVLNAKHHEKEAEIISKAGQANAVTIATNMAGRGTDIVLGEGVAELGGLYVIGTERHESRRIDNQLRGRSGRQGDPGNTKFFVSLEDDLMRIFGSDRIAKIMDTLGLPEDTPIEHGLISKSIEKAQTKVEKYYFSMRKQILEYDDVLNRQRETVYTLRDQLLLGEDITQRFKDLVNNLMVSIVRENYGEERNITNADHTDCITALTQLLHEPEIKLTVETSPTQDALAAQLTQFALKKYKEKTESYPPALFEALVTRHILLSTLDRKWIDHLNQMENLKEGIGLRAYGQKDPLLEYKIEGFAMFTQLMNDVTQEALEMILKAQIVVEETNEPTHARL